MTEPPSKAVNYILNKVDSTEGFIECPEDHGIVGFKVTDSKSSIEVALGPDEEPQFTVNLRIEANLNAVQCSMDLTQPSIVDELQQEIGEKYNKNLEKHIKTVQKKYGSDVFAFGEALHRRYPKVWKKYRENWHDKFKNVSIEVNTKIDIRRIGSIVQPLNEEVSE
ncbi:Ger(x)C family spore germination C-terminal domain-containing protein [Paenibacillus senegalensis]|uniref:Ger(x)C family spore germination C-terminal domain-containing protein n=1 Tax=Paenibacillus senegalensis TaxID=1465766 RepID=UPI001F2B134B|nr:Ger(x)C family spore germination C-terminal domain-containing protein [Paenibacillus senegalensis]